MSAADDVVADADLGHSLSVTRSRTAGRHRFSTGFVAECARIRVAAATFRGGQLLIRRCRPDADSCGSAYLNNRVKGEDKRCKKVEDIINKLKQPQKLQTRHISQIRKNKRKRVCNLGHNQN